MGKTSRRRFTAEFKTQVVLEALKEQKTLTELASEFKIHSNQISNWKIEFLGNAQSLFSKDKKAVSDDDREAIEKPLFEQIGRLEMENKFLKKVSNSHSQRK